MLAAAAVVGLGVVGVAAAEAARRAVVHRRRLVVVVIVRQRDLTHARTREIINTCTSKRYQSDTCAYVNGVGNNIVILMKKQYTRDVYMYTYMYSLTVERNATSKIQRSTSA